jgi:hypothetical protein
MEPKFLDIKLTAESCNLIVAALRKLPHETVHELVFDVIAQANQQQETAPPTEVEVVEAN